MRYLFLILFLIFSGCFQEGEYIEEGSTEIMYSMDPSKRCIEGHVFYYIGSAYGDALSGKFDDDGKPVKCTKEGKNEK